MTEMFIFWPSNGFKLPNPMNQPMVRKENLVLLIMHNLFRFNCF